MDLLTTDFRYPEALRETEDQNLRLPPYANSLNTFSAHTPRQLKVACDKRVTGKGHACKAISVFTCDKHSIHMEPSLNTACHPFPRATLGACTYIHAHSTTVRLLSHHSVRKRKPTCTPRHAQCEQLATTPEHKNVA